MCERYIVHHVYPRQRPEWELVCGSGREARRYAISRGEAIRDQRCGLVVIEEV